MNLIKTLNEAQKMYKETFGGKKFIFYSNSYTVKVEFKRNNFLHLTGIETNFSAKQFYKKIEDERLSLKDIKLKKDGSTMQKLSVIKEMPMILKKSQITSDCSIIYNFHLDSLIKTNKHILAIGVHSNFPKTLLNIRTSKHNFQNLKNFENVKSIEIYCLSSKELIEIINL